MYQKQLEEYPVIEITERLILSIQQYYKQSGCKGFVIGMSGGLDCSVVTALCAKANVPILAVSMPFEADKSKQRVAGINHGKLLCQRFSVPFKIVEITSAVQSIYERSDLEFSKENDFVIADTNRRTLSRANVLPRVRMTTLYYIAQMMGRLVIGTGNLSEITMGYFTKWGDGGSDFNPVKKITKSEMFLIAKHLNVPEEIINKKPSADLWDEQSDEQEMGATYFEIDSYIRTNTASEHVKELVKRARKRSAHKMKFDLLADQLDIFESEDTKSIVYRDSLSIRNAVFVQEQHIPLELELEFEEESKYFTLYLNHLAIACARVRELDGEIKIERFAVLPHYRRKGYGRLLVEHIVNKYQDYKIILSSQQQSLPFYLACQFVQTSEVFMEVDIPHVKMEYQK